MLKIHHYELLDIVTKGFVTGVLIGYLIVYGLRPAVPYPEYILDLFENKWIFLILLVIVYYAVIWDHIIGALLALSTIALVFDYIVFSNIENTNNENKKNIKIEDFAVFV